MQKLQCGNWLLDIWPWLMCCHREEGEGLLLDLKDLSQRGHDMRRSGSAVTGAGDGKFAA